MDCSDEIAGEIYKKNKSVPTEKEFITLVSKAIIDSNQHSKMIGLMNDPDFLPDVMSGYRSLGGVIKKFSQPKKIKSFRESVQKERMNYIIRSSKGEKVPNGQPTVKTMTPNAQYPAPWKTSHFRSEPIYSVYSANKKEVGTWLTKTEAEDLVKNANKNVKKSKSFRESVQDVMYRDYLPEGVGREDQKFLENQMMNRKGIQVKKIEAKTSDTWVCTGTDKDGNTEKYTVTINVQETK